MMLRVRFGIIVSAVIRRCSLKKTILVFVVVCLFGAPLHAITIGEERYVDSAYHAGDFKIVAQNSAAPIFVDSKDHAGVVRAVNDLQKDIERVTNCKAAITHEGKGLGSNAIIIGTIGKSEMIDRLVRDHKIDVTA